MPRRIRVDKRRGDGGDRPLLAAHIADLRARGLTVHRELLSSDPQVRRSHLQRQHAIMSGYARRLSPGGVGGGWHVVERYTALLAETDNEDN